MIVKAVWEVDRRLAEIVNAFNFTLLVTPINVRSARHKFAHSSRLHEPTFVYRPLPFAPAHLKRRLFEVPVERVENGTLRQLFEEKRCELDRKITMLEDRGTQRFLNDSLQLHGAVDDGLLSTALWILDRLPRRVRPDRGAELLNAGQILQQCREEIDRYRANAPWLNAKVIRRRDVPGLLVSKGNLLVGSGVTASADRIQALLQHEIGTHLVCHHNAGRQRIHLIRCGMTGYEEFQEGLAVLAEYLVGGLDRSRLRILAARVLAVWRMCDGASFRETFNELWQTHGFDRSTAFTLTMRVFRGGGFTKDAGYLRGLIRLLKYLGDGGRLDLLFLGKFAAVHVPIIEHLLEQHVLVPPPLRPRYLDFPESAPRLQGVHRGLTIAELVEQVDSINPDLRR